MSGWIVDPNSGTKALVEDAAEYDRWTRVHGWAETAEPAGDERVWVRHAETGGRSVLPHSAIGGYWAANGWAPSAPPEPVDRTKDPALADQTPQPVPAATTTKEKIRG